MHFYTTRFSLFLFLIFFASLPAAQACMGVARTINVNSFNAHMGTGGSGGIGLRHKEVVLTFDDGPSARSTPKVLKALQNECVKATFFVVGRMARANSKLLQRIARSGHTIAQHTENHAKLTNTSIASARANILKGISSVRSALGPYKSSSTKLFRYPYLARSAALDVMLRREKLLPFSAAVMSQDWKPGPGSGMVNRVMTRLARTQRGVILLHDIQAKTGAALPQLLRRLKQEGYKVVHIRSGRSGPGSSSGDLIASAKKSKKPQAVAKLNPSKKRSTKIAANTVDKKQPRKRWSLFSRNNRGLDQTTTGSVRKTTENSKRKSLQRVKLAKANGEKPVKRKRWRLFSRSDSKVDKTVTGSVRKKAKKTNQNRSKKTKVASKKPVKAKTGNLFARMKARSKARAEKRAKLAAKKKIEKSKKRRKLKAVAKAKVKSKGKERRKLFAWASRSRSSENKSTKKKLNRSSRKKTAAKTSRSKKKAKRSDQKSTKKKTRLRLALDRLKKRRAERRKLRAKKRASKNSG